MRSVIAATADFCFTLKYTFERALDNALALDAAPADASDAAPARCNSAIAPATRLMDHCCTNGRWTWIFPSSPR
jgi:hypothetical protein